MLANCIIAIHNLSAINNYHLHNMYIVYYRIAHYFEGFLFLDISKRPFSSKINIWGHLSMKIFPQLKVGSHESLRLQRVAVFNTCMMLFYHYFKPLHSEIPD